MPNHLKIFKRAFIAASVVLAGIVSNAFAQPQKALPACTQKAFAAFKQLPKLEYECPEALAGYDDKILKLPARTAAIARLLKAFQSFTEAEWWAVNVDELNACELHGMVGVLTDEEKENWRSGDYQFSILGDRQMRLVLRDDPCYQTDFNGSNVFLLYRNSGKVFVTQLLNGYYSRVANSIGLDFANLNGRRIIEVSTANSLPPSLVNYYFAIDPATKQATPKKFFKERNTLTNQVYSDMLMGDPKDFGLPKDAAELSIIRNHRLAASFSAYEENDRGQFDANGRKLRRIIYRWNGRIYVRGR